MPSESQKVERKKAYCVRRRVRAIDEMLVYADSAAEARERAEAGEYVDTERLSSSDQFGGYESIRRWPEEDK